MNRETRNRIQRATQAARELLEHEYTEQLSGAFDIRLDGTIAAEAGEHLDAAQRVLRTKLVTAIEHQRASGMTKTDAVVAYLREAAFTTLNRFVALKMLETRKLVQECISRGDQSSGFKEFMGLAAGLVQLTDHGYRIYLESLFDEIGREVRVLFDRREPGSLLWPRRQALLDLLDILNAKDLAFVWGEDETIGWVYQYFNSDEERRQMRAESQTPRDSRELAVRNQFFTPRYVVQFLTDNTLGRIWYEMRQGDTRLRDLDYLMRRPSEIFLAEGETAPVTEDAGDDNLAQDELLQRPVYVPFRTKKDPRDVRVLDPACGSGHFLLYAFDLLLTIYQESWADETSPASEATGRTMRDDFPEPEALQAAVPGLILRHNLYGIDIDARCAQIAAFALWMRAQRAFRDQGIACGARRAIQKTNIVVAEPMSGDLELRREFIATLEPKLGRLVEHVFDRMELAGEVGSLLRIEDDIYNAIRDIYGEHGQLFRVSDEERWQLAATEVLRALQAYAEYAANGRAFERRLFTEDASRGLGLIDLCVQKYDVAMMNPPFGQGASEAQSYVDEVYRTGRFDLGAAFVERMIECTSMFGVIANRTLWFGARLQPFRSQLLDRNTVSGAVDLGLGILDAFVETAMWVTEVGRRGGDGLWIGGTDASDKATAVRTACSTAVTGTMPEHAHIWSSSRLKALPGTAFSHWVHPAVCDMLDHTTTIARSGFETKQGLATMDNERFLRLAWEVPRDELGTRWYPYAKGGSYAPFVRDYHLLVDWAPSAHAAYSTRTGQFCCLITGQSSRYAFRPGVTYSTRTSRFSAGFFPQGALFDTKGSVIFCEDLKVGDSLDRVGTIVELCAILNSPLTQYLLDLRAGASDAGKARDYSQSMLASLPYTERFARHEVIYSAQQVADRLVGIASVIPERSEYRGIAIAPNIAELARVLEEFAAKTQESLSDLLNRTSTLYSASLRLPLDAAEEVTDFVRRTHREPHHELLEDWSEESVAKLHLEALLGACFANDQELKALPVVEMLESRTFDWASALPCLSKSLASHGDASVIMVDDPGHNDDLVDTLETQSLQYGTDTQSSLFRQACGALGYTPREWVQRGAFDGHLARRTLSRRIAPIYWQLATPSSSYSVWIYFHRFTDDTLYRVLNDCVVPKLRHEERKLTSLNQDAGQNPSALQRKEVHAQERFVEELRTFRDEVGRVAPLWCPNLNDGAIINFAPLWRLVPHHGAWQKECKATWDKLCKGDYDWAHLAMYLWPERVVPKCAEDRSLAIVHGLEYVFWSEDSDGKWRPRKVEKVEVDKLVKERTSAAVKDALERLLEASAPTTGRSSKRKANRAKRTRKRAASSRTEATRDGSPSQTRSSLAADSELLSKAKQAIAAKGGGANKAAVIEAIGISADEWNRAIKALLADGSVIQTGERRGARYHLRGGQS